MTVSSKQHLRKIWLKVLSVVWCVAPLQIESERKNSMNDYLI